MERFAAAQAAGKLHDARRAAINAKKGAPRSPFVREALGLVSYDLEQWHEAAQELLAYRRFAADCRHDPIVADCYRRLGNVARALDVLDEMRRAGVTGAVHVEAQVVRARVVVDTPNGARRAAEIVRDAIRGPGPLRLAHEQLRPVLAEVFERSGLTKSASVRPSGSGKP